MEGKEEVGATLDDDAGPPKIRITTIRSSLCTLPFPQSLQFVELVSRSSHAASGGGRLVVNRGSCTRSEVYGAEIVIISFNCGP